MRFSKRRARHQLMTGALSMVLVGALFLAEASGHEGNAYGAAQSSGSYDSRGAGHGYGVGGGDSYGAKSASYGGSGSGRGRNSATSYAGAAPSRAGSTHSAPSYGGSSGSSYGDSPGSSYGGSSGSSYGGPSYAGSSGSSNACNGYNCITTSNQSPAQGYGGGEGGCGKTGGSYANRGAKGGSSSSYGPYHSYAVQAVYGGSGMYNYRGYSRHIPPYGGHAKSGAGGAYAGYREGAGHSQALGSYMPKRGHGGCRGAHCERGTRSGAVRPARMPVSAPAHSQGRSNRYHRPRHYGGHRDRKGHSGRGTGGGHGKSRGGAHRGQGNTKAYSGGY